MNKVRISMHKILQAYRCKQNSQKKSFNQFINQGLLVLKNWKFFIWFHLMKILPIFFLQNIVSRLFSYLYLKCVLQFYQFRSHSAALCVPSVTTNFLYELFKNYPRLSNYTLYYPFIISLYSLVMDMSLLVNIVFILFG